MLFLCQVLGRCGRARAVQRRRLKVKDVNVNFAVAVVVVVYVDVTVKREKRLTLLCMPQHFRGKLWVSICVLLATYTEW